MIRPHLLLSFSLLLTAALPTFAQAPTSAPKVRTEHPSQTPTEKAAALTRRMNQQLTLTPEQYPRISALNAQLTADLSALRGAKATDQQVAIATKKEHRAKAQQVRAAYETNLQAVLTPEQYQTYERERTEREQKHRARQAGRRATRGPGSKGGQEVLRNEPTLTPVPAEQ